MEKKNEIIDIVILGGGASGIMAAISAKRTNPNQNILIIEGSFALGRKLLISGAGRGNILNTHLGEKEYEKFYHTNNFKLVKDVFSQFGYQDIRKYFEDLGVVLYEEEKNSKGKLFPVSEQARNIIRILENEIKILGIKILLNSYCLDIFVKNDKFYISYENENQIEEIICNKVVIATGGMSYPSTGSTGIGFKILEKLGHNIYPLIPIAVPLLSKDSFIKTNIGLKIKAKVSSFIDDEFEKEVTDDIIFTKYGISGSSVLTLSSEIAVEFTRNQKSNIKIRVNFLPEFSKEDLITRWEKYSEQILIINLYGLIPQKFSDSILEALKIHKEKLIKDLNIEERKKLFDILYNKTIQIIGIRGWNDAEFTAGGLDASEVVTKTLESIITPNLYVCGEVLNVDGEIGGFNLAWAWASGYIAGSSAAKT
jgi:hypothetical protein